MTFLTSLLFLVSVLSAAEQPGHLIENLFQAFSESHVSIDATYELVLVKTVTPSSSGVIKGDARVTIQGEMYAMEGNGFSVLCDGKDVCISDKSAKEIIYEPVSGTDSRAYMMNPAVLFSRMEENFSVSGVRSDSDRTVYELSAKAASGMDGCRLCLDTTTGDLMSADFYMTDGNKVSISVSRFKIEPKKSVTEYGLPSVSSFGADWVVTDLR